MWLGAAASVVLLVLATLGAAYSPLFAVRDDHGRRAHRSWMPRPSRPRSSDQLGTPLPLVDESAVKAALVTFPLVESYSLEARPPHELVVRIVERTARSGSSRPRAGYTLVDAAGVALSTTADPVAGRVRSSRSRAAPRPPAFEAVGQVMRSLPESIRLQVTAVAASTPDDVTLTLGGTEHAGRVGERRRVRAQGRRARRRPWRRGRRPVVSVYDVSSPRAVVVRLSRSLDDRFAIGMSRHAHDAPPGATASAYFQFRNCIPGNSLYLY